MLKILTALLVLSGSGLALAADATSPYEPAGPVGPQGSTGPPGEQGPAGRQGAVGAQGPAAPTPPEPRIVSPTLLRLDAEIGVIQGHMNALLSQRDALDLQIGILQKRLEIAQLARDKLAR